MQKKNKNRRQRIKKDYRRKNWGCNTEMNGRKITLATYTAYRNR